MLRGSSYAYVVLSLASCAIEEVSSTEVVSSAETPLTRVQQIQADAEILFSHDHVRDTTHFNNAIHGGVTAMTIELMVDNLIFDNGHATRQEVYGPLNVSSFTIDEVVPFDPDNPNDGTMNQFESRTHANARFNCALSGGASCPRVPPPLCNLPPDQCATLPDLQSFITASNGQMEIVRKVDDIDTAKVSGHLGLIIGTEGTMMLADNRGDSVETDVNNRIEALYAVGWRKATLFRAYANPFVWVTGENTLLDLHNMTPLGRRLIPQLNKRGVVVDVMHLDGRALPDVLATTSAPLQMSHEWAGCTIIKDAQGNIISRGPAGNPMQHNQIVAAGGGHGVISVNVLGSYYNYNGGVCPDGSGPLTRDVDGLANTLMFMVAEVGIDHVGIGPDFQPMPDTYTLSDYDQIPALIQALTTKINPRTGQLLTDADIKKLLGGNLRDLYQRIWDPTHGYDGGAAHFTLCSDSSTNPDCVAAASDSGQGDLRHRAINCAHPSGLTPVGTQLQYNDGQWFFKNLAGSWVHCATSVLQSNGQLHQGSGSTLVISWGDGESRNARVALWGTSACDGACQQATLFAGAGTDQVRALNCLTPSSNGVVDLQLVNTTSGWNTYNIVGQLTPCTAGSTFVAHWNPGGVLNANANARLCDDYNNHPACAAAAANGGNGSASAKALSCRSSIAGPGQFGTVALQVFYQDVWAPSPTNPNQLTPVPGGGHWQYWAVDRTPHPCVHGSVVIATTLP